MNLDTANPDTATGAAAATTPLDDAAATDAAIDATTMWVGRRLRAIREQKQMSLSDVDELTSGDFGPSTLGAYERGMRTISIQRLDRLADFYDIPIEQLLPRPAGHTPITTRTSPVSTRLSLDTTKLELLDGAPFLTMMRYIDLVRAQRNDPNRGIVTLRSADAVVIASMLAVPVSAVIARLTALDLLHVGPNPTT